MKKFLLALCIFLFTLPIYTQTITIDKTALENAIKTEVTKEIQKAVDDAVAIAIKDTTDKYVLQLAAKDVVIAQKDGQIQKDKIQKQQDDIDLENSKIKLNNYKNTHGWKRDTIIGGLSGAAGLVLGGLAGAAIK
jgi:hypothetical protein